MQTASTTLTPCAGSLTPCSRLCTHLLFRVSTFTHVFWFGSLAKMYQPEQHEKTNLSLESQPVEVSHELYLCLHVCVGVCVCVCVWVCLCVCVVWVSVFVQQNYSMSPPGTLAHGDVFTNGIPKEKSRVTTTKQSKSDLATTDFSMCCCSCSDVGCHPVSVPQWIKSTTSCWRRSLKTKPSPSGRSGWSGHPATACRSRLTRAQSRWPHGSSQRASHHRKSPVTLKDTNL